MPLPENESVVKTSEALLETMQALAGGIHPGFRPAHAKGILLRGTFTPTAEAASLSKAQHFTAPSTPMLARFSSSTGLPALPDTEPAGNPRGLALRFELASSPRRVHTDIVAHSVDGFPGTTGEEALAFFRVLRDGGDVPAFLGANPKAAAFVALPKPTPSSFARERFFAVCAFRLVAANGTATYVRYRVEPVAGVDELSADALKEKSPNFLFDEVPRLLEAGPVKFKLVAQIAEQGDVTNDNTVKWPEDRRRVELGTISLTSVAEENEALQKTIIFDPVPRVEGVEPSDDPLLDVRAGVYLLSGRQRRAA